jgi:lactate dehydrogenase-like 2-hydroxyacid dehydrogenase
MSKIAITDYFVQPDLETEVLGDLVGTEVGNDTEVLLVWHEQINEKYLKNLPNLRGVQRYGVGYDTLDIDYLKSRGIICCNNPDYGVDEVSDTAVAMILNIARGVSHYNYLAKSYFDSWQENINPRIKRNSETVVGIIGAGRIGGSVVLKCNALKFKTAFYDPYKDRGYEKLLNSKRFNSLDELLENSDIISIHTPLSHETKGVIDQKFLSKMKYGASLVNTARGGLFKDMDLLYKALSEQRIYSLAIDVLEYEPPKPNLIINAWRNSEKWLNGRLIINPHTSYYSQESYREIRINAAKNALRIYLNEKPFNII